MTGSEAYKDSFRKPREGLEPHHRVLDVCTGFGYLAKHASQITIDEVDAQNGCAWIPFFESVGIHSAVKEMKAAGVRHYFASLSDPAPSRTRQYLITMQNTHTTIFTTCPLVARHSYIASIGLSRMMGNSCGLIIARPLVGVLEMPEPIVACNALKNLSLCRSEQWHVAFQQG